jgi:histidine triad (HIT) family protein
MTLFEKIAARQIPADIVHETEDILAFKDIDPKAPVHVLVVPKRPIPRIGEAQDPDTIILGKLLLAASETARKLGIDKSGYRLTINNGKDAGESVPHLHVHLLGGRTLSWPPG